MSHVPIRHRHASVGHVTRVCCAWDHHVTHHIQTYQQVMSRIRMRHVTHVNGSYHTCKWVMAHTSIRHTLYHSCERVVNKWCRVMSHASASRGIMAREVTHVHECIYAHPHAQTHGPCSWSWRNLFCWHSKQSYLSSRPSTCTHRSAVVSGHMCV